MIEIFSFLIITGCAEDLSNSIEELEDIELETELDLSDWASATHTRNSNPN